MKDFNLISSATSTLIEAVEVAKQLAATIATSPSDGIFNTLRLLRPDVLSEQKLVELSVSYVKTLQSKDSFIAQSSALQNIQWPIKEKLSLLEVVGETVPVAALLKELQMKQAKGKPLCVIFNDTIVDVTEIREVFDLCGWFSRKDRLPVSFLFKGEEFPLLLALIADHSVVIEDTIFDGAVVEMNFSYAFAMMRHGVSGCARLLLNSSNKFTFGQVADLKLIDCHEVSSILEGVDLMQGRVQTMKVWSAHNETFAEHCISLLHAIDIKYETHNSVPPVHNGVAHIEFEGARDLKSQLTCIKDIAGLLGVVFYLNGGEGLNQ